MYFTTTAPRTPPEKQELTTVPTDRKLGFDGSFPLVARSQGDEFHFEVITGFGGSLAPGT
jgi:hypothetical protein